MLKENRSKTVSQMKKIASLPGSLAGLVDLTVAVFQPYQAHCLNQARCLSQAHCLTSSAEGIGTAPHPRTLTSTVSGIVYSDPRLSFHLSPLIQGTTCVGALPQPIGDQHPSAAVVNGSGSHPYPNTTTVSVVGVAQTNL